MCSLVLTNHLLSSFVSYISQVLLPRARQKPSTPTLIVDYSMVNVYEMWRKLVVIVELRSLNLKTMITSQERTLKQSLRRPKPSVKNMLNLIPGHYSPTMKGTSSPRVESPPSLPSPRVASRQAKRAEALPLSPQPRQQTRSPLLRHLLSQLLSPLLRQQVLLHLLLVLLAVFHLVEDVNLRLTVKPVSVFGCSVIMYFACQILYLTF